jgi:hypothetical protein
MVTSGGGGGRSVIQLNLQHKTVDGLTVYRNVYVDNTEVYADTFTASDKGGVFDDTINFSADGKTFSWRAYSTNRGLTYVNSVLSDGTNSLAFTITGADANLTNKYDISAYIP